MNQTYQYHKLSNGIRIIYKQVNSPISHVGLVVNAGTRDELSSENGIAHFIEHLIFKGTHKRNTYQVLSYLENIGGDLNAYTTKEETFFYATVLNEYMDRAIELIADIVFNSTFNKKDIELEKEVVKEEIKSYKDNLFELAFDEFENLVFEGHPLGTFILGSLSSVNKIDKNKIIQFINRTYHTDEMVVSIVGNVKFEKCIAIIEKHLGIIAENKRNYVREPFVDFKTQHQTRKTRSLQSHLIFGQALPQYDENKNIAATLLNNIFGGPGLTSRLNLAIREKKGYAYTIESTYTPLSDVGLFMTYAALDKKNLNQCIDLIFKEIKTIQTKALGTLQLHRAKLQLIGQICIAHESHLTEMLSIGKNHLKFDSVETTAFIVDKIQRITANDLLNIANEMLQADKMSSLIFAKDILDIREISKNKDKV